MGACIAPLADLGPEGLEQLLGVVAQCLEQTGTLSPTDPDLPASYLKRVAWGSANSTILAWLLGQHQVIRSIGVVPLRALQDNAVSKLDLAARPCTGRSLPYSGAAYTSVPGIQEVCNWGLRE